MPTIQTVPAVTYPPQSRSIREWLTTLPDGYRERALKNMCVEYAFIYGPSLPVAISSAFNWVSSPEKLPFWAAVNSHYSAGTPLPPLPEDSDGWIPHSGQTSTPPVPADTYVEIRCRDGMKDRGLASRWSLSWRNDKSSLDIVAYRILPQDNCKDSATSAIPTATLPEPQQPEQPTTMSEHLHTHTNTSHMNLPPMEPPSASSTDAPAVGQYYVTSEGSGTVIAVSSKGVVLKKPFRRIHISNTMWYLSHPVRVVSRREVRRSRRRVNLYLSHHAGTKPSSPVLWRLVKWSTKVATIYALGVLTAPVAWVAGRAAIATILYWCAKLMEVTP